MQLSAIQSAIGQLGFDGWLLYDFRGLNVLARRVIALPPDALLSRRWFYFIPARGEPVARSVKQDPYDLVILDVGLSGIDGFEVLRRVRSQGSTVPVCVVPALATTAHGNNPAARSRVTDRDSSGPRRQSSSSTGTRRTWSGRSPITFAARSIDQCRSCDTYKTVRGRSSWRSRSRATVKAVKLASEPPLVRIPPASGW